MDTTFLPLALVGNGAIHEIQITDVLDIGCSAILSVQVPDCVCELDFNIELISLSQIYDLH